MATPEVVELLERFVVKKQNVKHRLNGIVDDLFGDFVSEMTQLVANQMACQKCTNNSNNSTTDLNTQQQQQLQQKSPTQSLMETTLRSVQSRAKDMIKEEFYDDPIYRFVEKNNLKQQQKVVNKSNDYIDCEPEITLTPINADNASIPSSSSEANHVNDNSEQLIAATILQTHHQQPNQQQQKNNKSDDDDDENDDEYEDSEMECECSECMNEIDGIKSENGTHEDGSGGSCPNGHHKKVVSESGELASGEKSLEELNTLCSGLPYLKTAGKYICHFQDCGQELKSRHNLLLHQRAHLGIRPYRCKWPECNYTSNQSSAVIRHIRTKHFQLPLTMREQAMKNIADDRDPKAFLEVVAISDVSPSSPNNTQNNADSDNVAVPCSGTVKDEQVEQTNPLNLEIRPKSGNANKANNSNKKAAQSILVAPSPQGSLKEDFPPPNSNNGNKQNDDDDSDEDDIDSDDNDDFEPPNKQTQRNMLFNNGNNNNKQMPQNAAQFKLKPNQQQYNQSLFDYARKRRLESKIFASANRGYNSNRNINMNPSNNINSSNINSGANFFLNGPIPKKAKKSYNQPLQPKQQSSFSMNQQQPTAKAHPQPTESLLSNLSSLKARYLFCPEPECPGIFRTQSELERHLNDVHNMGPSASGTASSSSDDNDNSFANIFVCQWPKCHYRTMSHTSAINHVRSIHLTVPRNSQQPISRRAQYLLDQRNPNDYIHLMPMVTK